MSEFITDIKCEGVNITFREFLEGSNQLIFDEEMEIEQMIDAAFTEENDFTVEEYLCPIVDQILIESVQEDKEVYIELLSAIKKAYGELKRGYKLNMEGFDEVN